MAIEPEFAGVGIDADDAQSSLPPKRVPAGDVFEAARAGDIDRLQYLIENGVNVNARDPWDSTALYYSCLTGHLDAARVLLESGAICSEHTYDGDRCHYAALNLRVRKLLKVFEARPLPLPPLQAALRETFLACPANSAFLELLHPSGPRSSGYQKYFPPDITFFVQGRPIEAHRVILSARSQFFKERFATKWRNQREIRFANVKLSYRALYGLIYFFYCDRLEVLVDDMDNLVQICKICKCSSLQKLLEKELILQKHAEYKALGDVDRAKTKFILQGLSLPEEDRLPASLQRLLQISLASSSPLNIPTEDNKQTVVSDASLADLCVRVGGRNFHCHQVVLASRSEYFKARLFHMGDSLTEALPCDSVPCLEEHDLSEEIIKKILEYMYTDSLKDINPDQSEEMFDVASRYLLFPLKQAVADAFLPHLKTASPVELCHYLILSDVYGVFKIREYCLDVMACNFEDFANLPEFRALLLILPPPSGDSSLRTTIPSAPGSIASNIYQGNILDDLREKWLETEAAGLDKRDESVAIFDRRLEELMNMAKNEDAMSAYT